MRRATKSESSSLLGRTSRSAETPSSTSPYLWSLLLLVHSVLVSKTSWLTTISSLPEKNMATKVATSKWLPLHISSLQLHPSLSWLRFQLALCSSSLKVAWNQIDLPESLLPMEEEWTETKDQRTFPNKIDLLLTSFARITLDKLFDFCPILSISSSYVYFHPLQKLNKYNKYSEPTPIPFLHTPKDSFICLTNYLLTILITFSSDESKLQCVHPLLNWHIPHVMDLVLKCLFKYLFDSSHQFNPTREISKTKLLSYLLLGILVFICPFT